jgi:predicted SnoaL-like aldol condensation-catalyzing enzyme
MAGSRKEAAVSFLKLSASGRAREAYKKYVGPKFKHHNPFFRGDAKSLMEAMEKNAVENPNKELEVQHAVEEGDIVIVHSMVQLLTNQKIATAHIFRFENGKIVELWDIGQMEPEGSPNENGMF